MESHPTVAEEKLKSFFPEGRIPAIVQADVVQTMLKELNVSIETLLYSLQQYAKRNSRHPISNFAVGIAGLFLFPFTFFVGREMCLASERRSLLIFCIGLAKSGRIYLGHNIEFEGCPLNYSVHGEQCTIARLVNHDEQGNKHRALSIDALTLHSRTDPDRQINHYHHHHQGWR